MGTGYCSFAYTEDSGGGFEPIQEEVDELTARINAKPIYTHKEDGKTEGTIIESTPAYPLVRWAAFKDNYGIDINTVFVGEAIYPMEILDSPNVNVIYRKG